MLHHQWSTEVGELRVAPAMAAVARTGHGLSRRLAARHFGGGVLRLIMAALAPPGCPCQPLFPRAAHRLAARDVPAAPRGPRMRQDRRRLCGSPPRHKADWRVPRRRRHWPGRSRMVIVWVMSVPHISLTLSVMIVPSCGLASVRPTRCGASKPFSRITRRTRRGGSRERNKSTGKQRPRPGIHAAEAKDQVSGSHHGRIHGRTTGQKVDLPARATAGALTCRPGLC